MQSTHPVLELEERLVAAQLNGDAAELDVLLADDLIFTSFNGELGRKADDLGLHRSGRFRITRMQRLEREARDLGDSCVVVVLMDTAAVFDGVPMQKILRYTRVWAKRNDRWQLAAAHLGEVATQRAG